MLKKANNPFNKSKEQKKDFDTPLFKLKTYKGREDTGLRIVVSKKIDKRAVVRNRTKRVYKKIINDLGFDKKQDTLVIIVKKSIDFKEKENIEKLIKDTLNKK